MPTLIQDPAARRRFLRTGLALGGAALPALGAAAAESPAGLTAAPRSQAGAPPRLTVHAIDGYHGATGAGLLMTLSRFEDGKGWQPLATARTVAGGRTAQPLLEGEAYRAGRYELLLHLGDYFKALGAKQAQPAFLSEVPLRFVVRDAAERVHLPVLFSPWGYSYYRGS
ncbi:hydroxyisourate hydrolase [Azohydromonas lata]|uniref:Hydroxyisourate hydrolase n=1 Tax=Azohydromonas lata TaxID=45677 RepID=A0ABU5ILY7_9BURK|nr:hydroxyisourate hydrolase [Azohydromonas lata]MDZ5459917.1 hydroxyisourate hydrolase [Azohydromonas lata]